MQRKRQQKYLKKKEEHRKESNKPNNDESILVVQIPTKKTNCPKIRSTRHLINSKKEYNKLMKEKKEKT